MAAPDGNELLLHATAVALDGRAVLICGPSGSGKSDLALRLIDGGAELIADDQTILRREAGGLFARSPGTIAGRIEVRGIGIVALPHRDDVPVALCVDLVPAAMVERLPEPAAREILGVTLPLLRLAPFEASTAAKLRLAAMRLPRQ